MDLDRSFSSPTSPPIYKKKTNPDKGRPRRDKSPKKGSLLPQCQKEEGNLPNPQLASKSISIKYFKCLGKGHRASQCPNKRGMILLEDGTLDNDSSKFESLSTSEFDASCEYSPDEEGDMSM
ncbi:hypothetical protein CR513_45745, partial [Mucuna pruriens]